MGKVLDNKCPSCNAPIKFDPKLQKFKCEYCGAEYNAEDIQKMQNEQPAEEKEKETKAKEANPEVKDDTVYVDYHCPDCGAEIIADEQTAATFCVYCGNTSIIKNRLTGKFAPSKIIPFKKEKQEAIEAFKSLKKGKPLVPKDFVTEQNIEKITGVYIPFWLYTVFVNGNVTVMAQRITTWRSGNTRFTKTDTFDCIRDGEMTFRKVPVEGSNRFDNDIMNSIEPFDYNDLIDYNHAYLSGFLAEKYNIESEEASKEATKRTINSAKDEMLNSVIGYNNKIIRSENLNTKINEFEYVLLPVWMLNVKYKDKMYKFAMNGETGKFVGNIPLDKKKAWIIGISVFILTALVVLLFAWMIGG